MCISCALREGEKLAAIRVASFLGPVPAYPGYCRVATMRFYLLSGSSLVSSLVFSCFLLSLFQRSTHLVASNAEFLRSEAGKDAKAPNEGNSMFIWNFAALKIIDSIFSNVQRNSCYVKRILSKSIITKFELNSFYISTVP